MPKKRIIMHFATCLLIILFFAGCTFKEATLALNECNESKVFTMVKKGAQGGEAVSVNDNRPEGTLPVDEERPIVQSRQNVPIFDLQTYPQNATAYTDNIRSRDILAGIQKAYKKHYFSPWKMNAPPESLHAIKWPFRSYGAKGSYGQNLKPLPQEWFDEMLDASNFDAYGTENRYAITLQFSHLRNFPTNKPLFRDPEDAGEGFPFDYLQNSGIHANEPIFVSHYSKDGAWVYVFSAYATGWLPTPGISFLSKSDTMRWQDSRQLHIVKDGYPIKDNKNRFIFYGRLGMMLPIIRSSKEGYTVLTITPGAYNQPTFTHAKIPKDAGNEGVLPLNADTLPSIANVALQSRYGWGGLYEERDCSSMLRDLYAPFGIWLPRNSYQQAQVGKIISFENMGREAKLRIIKEQGVPFETLLYRKGHILLYVGEYNGHVMVMHNVWGVKTKDGGKEGRRIIGKTVISTLNIGCNQPNYDTTNSLLEKLESMNIITLSADLLR